MHFRNAIIFFILVYTTGNTLVAQQKWGLNQCISFAIENNTDLQRYDIQKKISAEDLKQSKRNLLPGISASSRASLSFGRSVDPNTNDIINTEFFNNSYDLSSSITIFNGFRLQNRIQYEKFRKKAAEYNHLNAIDDLAFNVMNAYFNVIYYKEMLEIAKKQVETSKLNLKATEKQLELGLLAKSDLLEMKANLETEELRQIQVENNLKSSLLALRQNMNLTDDTGLELEEEPFSAVSNSIPPMDQIFTRFVEWSPSYQSLICQLNVSKKSLSLSRSGLYPTINASGTISSGFYETNKDNQENVIAFRDQLKNNKSQHLGASLSIPVFSRWANRSSIKQAKLGIELAKAQLESERQKLYFKMSQNINDMQAYEREYLQYEKQEEADKLAYQTAEKKLTQGLISVIDFYVVKNRYANTQSQLLRTKLQLGIKRKTLDFYMGKRFWE